MVRPKKHLGQHFLQDRNIAKKIVEALTFAGDVIEVGPGTGVLTRLLAERTSLHLKVSEIDRESVRYLEENFPTLSGNILEGDFLELDLRSVFPGPMAVIGNFPYNISSQIFFKILEHRDQVKQAVGMVQKEVAERIASPPGNKTYGLLSVLLQAFYRVELLFKVPPSVFVPPPKVTSSVIRLERNDKRKLACDEALFFRVVKMVFQYRRKTLRNGLKGLNLPADFLKQPVFDLRAERLSAVEFENLVADIGKILNS